MPMAFKILIRASVYEGRCGVPCDAWGVAHQNASAGIRNFERCSSGRIPSRINDPDRELASCRSATRLQHLDISKRLMLNRTQVPSIAVRRHYSSATTCKVPSNTVGSATALGGYTCNCGHVLHSGEMENLPWALGIYGGARMFHRCSASNPASQDSNLILTPIDHSHFHPTHQVGEKRIPGS